MITITLKVDTARMTYLALVATTPVLGDDILSWVDWKRQGIFVNGSISLVRIHDHHLYLLMNTDNANDKMYRSSAVLTGCSGN